MHRTLWLVGACASAALFVGCAHDGMRSDDAMLGRVPMEAKQPIFTAQHNIDVAKANVTAAERARREAGDFATIADREYDAAKSRLSAAQKAVDLGRRSGSDETLSAGQQNLTVAQRELEAFRAKRDYAHRIVDVRDTEMQAANARLDLANDDLAFARADVLERNGYHPRQKVFDVRDRRDRKAADVATLDARIAQLDQQAARERSDWEARRRAYNVASRGNVMPVEPPAPPRQIQPESMPRLHEDDSAPRRAIPREPERPMQPVQP